MASQIKTTTHAAHTTAHQSADAAAAGRRNVRLTVEYDGTRYAGWQRQSNSLTVQQVLEEALALQMGHRVQLSVAGRTDSGVHAVGQVANFHTETRLTPRAIQLGALRYLPNDVAISSVSDVPLDFDSRRSARLRWYRYFLCNRSVRPAIASQYLTHVIGRLDLDRLQDAANTLAGRHDFSAFRAIACTAGRTLLDLQPINIKRQEDGILILDFKCRSFLQNMVRILAGTMVSCARGKLSVGAITEMLETGVRPREAVTLSPNGLFLYRVLYGTDTDA